MRKENRFLCNKMWFLTALLLIENCGNFANRYIGVVLLYDCNIEITEMYLKGNGFVFNCYDVIFFRIIKIEYMI